MRSVEDTMADLEGTAKKKKPVEAVNTEVNGNDRPARRQRSRSRSLPLRRGRSRGRREDR